MINQTVLDCGNRYRRQRWQRKFACDAAGRKVYELKTALQAEKSRDCAAGEQNVTKYGIFDS